MMLSIKNSKKCLKNASNMLVINMFFSMRSPEKNKNLVVSGELPANGGL